MAEKDHEVAKLRRELQQLRSSFSAQIAVIETRLDALGTRSSESVDAQQESPSTVPDTSVGESTAPGNLTKPGSVPDWNRLDESDAWLEEQLRRYAGKLLLFVTLQLGPISQFLGMGLDTWHHYRKQGRGAVFVMTAGGAIALIFGFGFLLQYSLNNILGDLARVIFCFFCAEALCAMGIFIHRRRKLATDYGSALIGIGIVLNYLSIYFLGPYYGFIGVISGLVLFSLVSLAGILLAMLFQTRVVALIALLGGSLTPAILDVAATAGSYYFLYQLVVAAAYLWVAERIAWYLLTRVALLASIVSVEYQLSAVGNGFDLVTVLSMHGFFYLFAVHLILSHRRDTAQSRNLTVTISASLLLFFAATLWQVIVNPVALGWFYAGNALILLGSVFFIERRELVFHISPVPMILLGFGGLLGLAIYSLIGGELLGLLWGFEGLLMVTLGFVYQDRSSRMEGYLIVVLGLIFGGYHTLLWASTFPTLGFDTLWLQMAAFGLVLWSLAQVFDRNRAVSDAIDLVAGTIAKESCSVWISILWLSSAAVLVTGYWAITAAVPLTLLLLRGRHLNSSFSTTLGLLHFLLFLGQTAAGIIEVHSVMFRDLPLAAKIGLIEAAACLWLFHWYFQKLDPGSYFASAGFYLRQLFYVLLPLFFLPRIIHSYPDLLPFGLWVSLAVALILFHYTNSLALKGESILLAWAATLITLVMVASGDFSKLYSGEVLLAGVVTFLLVGYFTSAWRRFDLLGSPYKQSLELAPHYLAGAIWLIIAMLSRDPGLASSMLVVYYTFMLVRWPLFGVIRDYLTFSYAVLWLMAVAAIVYHAVDRNSIAPLEDLVVLISLAILLYRDVPQRRLLHQMVLPKTIKFWIFHSMIALGYMLALEVWFGTAFGPWTTVILVVQATVVLFESQTAAYAFLLRLSLFIYAAALAKILLFDIAGFSLVQKIIAFIVIGIVLLVSAYQMQKYRDRNSQSGYDEATES